MLENRNNWVVGSHVMVHRGSSLGIWTANEDYGIKLLTEAKINSDNSTNSGTGREVLLSWIDRKALYRAIHMTQTDMVNLYWKLKAHK